MFDALPGQLAAPFPAPFCVDDVPLPTATPFLKWVGGKRRLVPALRTLLPADHARRRYVAPFAGGGALFFALRPDRALLADAVPGLMRAYRAMRDQYPFVRAQLVDLERGGRDPEAYYRARDRYNAPNVATVEGAALLIYLMKAGYNGLHRVNSAGRFNAPVGHSASPLRFDYDALAVSSRALRGVELHCQDFEATLSCAGSGDLVYCDPPYWAAFDQYTAARFGAEDHARLADAARAAAQRGAAVLVSNADCPEVRALYDGFQLNQVAVTYSVAARANSRRRTPELIAIAR